MSDIRSIVLLLCIIATSVSLGWLGFVLYGNAADLVVIEYISKSEILELEKQRVASGREEHLFLGRTDDALALMVKYAKLAQDNNTKVIFVDETLQSDSATSISKHIHKAVIEKLKESKL